MTAHNAVDEIEMLVRSRHGLIIVDSIEDDRVEEVLRHVASRLSLHCHIWRRTRGVSRGGGAGDGNAPLSTTMAERLTALRTWALDRTVNADTAEWRADQVPQRKVSQVTM